MENKRVYFDYNASTPVDPRVLESMLPYFTEVFGNASSRAHAFGWEAAEAVAIAREQVANLIGCETNELTFTSGSTESLNLALQGIARMYQSKGKHLITFSTEHKAVLEPLFYLKELGWEVDVLPVDERGLPNLEHLKKAIRSDTVFVAAMLANNESGIVWPIAEMAELTRASGAFFLCDATQACGKIPVDVNELGVDVLALSAHKFYGPKGCGALYLRRKNPRVNLTPLFFGGGHENGKRPGTLNVPGIVGLGKAAELAKESLVNYAQMTSQLRDLFEQELIKLDGIHIHGIDVQRLPNTSAFRIEKVPATRLIQGMPNYAFSTGSACSSALPEPSHVWTALGLTEEQAYETVRFSFGMFNQEEEIRNGISILRNIVNG